MHVNRSRKHGSSWCWRFCASSSFCVHILPSSVGSLKLQPLTHLSRVSFGQFERQPNIYPFYTKTLSKRNSSAIFTTRSAREVIDFLKNIVIPWGTYSALLVQLQPQEISPPPTANLDRSNDKVYENVTGLVKAVIEMSNRIPPAAPDEYVPMV